MSTPVNGNELGAPATVLPEPEALDAPDGSVVGAVLVAAAEPTTGGDALAAATFGGVGGWVVPVDGINVVVVVDVVVVVVLAGVQSVPLTVWKRP
jgi:hypothetical protein